jgi:hypothetical protein
VALEPNLSLDEVGFLVGKSGDWVKKRIANFEHSKVGRTRSFTPEQAEAFRSSFIRPVGSDGEGDGTDPLRDQSSKSRNRRK